MTFLEQLHRNVELSRKQFEHDIELTIKNLEKAITDASLNHQRQMTNWHLPPVFVEDNRVQAWDIISKHFTNLGIYVEGECRKGVLSFYWRVKP